MVLGRKGRYSDDANIEDKLSDKCMRLEINYSYRLRATELHNEATLANTFDSIFLS